MVGQESGRATSYLGVIESNVRRCGELAQEWQKMGKGDLPAVTRLRVISRGPRRSLVEAEPISGRQHQIRVHLALLGHSIVGDKLYGPDENLFLAHLNRALTEAELAVLGHPRQALHAYEVALPWKGEVRRFVAPWPAELDALWRG